MQQPARRRAAHAATLLFLGLLLLAGGARPAAARALKQDDSDSSSSPSPSPDAPASGPSDGSYGDLSGGVISPSNNYSDNAEGRPLLTPSTIKINGRTIYYEIPIDPKGIVIYFHGCYHNGYDFWPQSEDCSECRGEASKPCPAHAACAMPALRWPLPPVAACRPPAGFPTDCAVGTGAALVGRGASGQIVTTLHPLSRLNPSLSLGFPCGTCVAAPHLPPRPA
jgi:hypothetical protein